MNPFQQGDAPSVRGWTPFRIGAAVFGAAALVTASVMIPKLVEDLPANSVMVIQSVTGSLNCYIDPGPKWQGLGSVTVYPRRGTYSFDKHMVDPAGVPQAGDTGKQLQFNEGGTARLYGTVNWEMPLACPKILDIHRTFNSAAGVEAQGVARMVNLAIQLAGSTMTSLESFAERKGELIEIINDQAQNGAYKMTTKRIEVLDPVTGEKKMVSAAEIVRDGAKAIRQQASILEQFEIHLQPMSIELLEYSKVVRDQITAQQSAINKVKLAQATALEAIQQTITAEKQGQANAAKAKWEQETIKASEVVKAEQGLAVATLAAREAEQYKREQILRGEGDSERRRLVMSADGALETKLDYYLKVQSIWATNFGNFKGQMVPQVSMGGTGANALSGTQALVEMLSAKTARELALDLSNIGVPPKK